MNGLIEGAAMRTARGRKASPGTGETWGVAWGRLLALRTAPQPPAAQGGVAEAIWRGRRERALRLPALPPPSSPVRPAQARKPAGTSSRHYSGIRKDRSPFSTASSSFLASIPRAPRGDTWSWGPAAPGFPGSDWAPATAPTRHTTHLLAGAELALGRSPEEGGPGGEEEVLGVLLQAAVAAAHAAGPVARGPPPRGAGGQAGGAAPARPARFPARGPKPPAGRPAAAAAAAQSVPAPPAASRLPGPAPGAARAPETPSDPAPWTATPPRPRPALRGPRPERPGTRSRRSGHSRRRWEWGRCSWAVLRALLFPSSIWGAPRIPA